MPTDNKVTGIALIAEKVQKATGMSNKRKCAELVKTVCEAIADTLIENGEVKVKDYFTLRLRKVSGRVYTIPQGRGKIEKPEHIAIKFSPHTKLVNRLNKDE